MFTQPQLKDHRVSALVANETTSVPIEFFDVADIAIMNGGTNIATYQLDDNQEWNVIHTLILTQDYATVSASELGYSPTLVLSGGHQTNNIISIYVWNGTAWVVEQIFTTADLPSELYSPQEAVTLTWCAVYENRIVAYVVQPHQSTTITFDRSAIGVWSVSGSQTTGHPGALNNQLLSGDWLVCNGVELWKWNGTTWLVELATIGVDNAREFEYPYVIGNSWNGSSYDWEIYDVTGGVSVLDQVLKTNVSNNNNLRLHGLRVCMAYFNGTEYIREIYERINGTWSVIRITPSEPAVTPTITGVHSLVFSRNDNYSIVSASYSDIPTWRLWDDIIR